MIGRLRAQSTDSRARMRTDDDFQRPFCEC